MSYPPPHHQEANWENAIATIKTFPLATVISIKDREPLITHLPLMYKTSEKGFGKLIGHIDKFNPQATLLQDGHSCTILFHGPDTYISPSIYTTSQLPTWNYIKIHLNGKVSRITDKDEVKDSIIAMTEHLEAPEQRYVLEKENPRMEAFINYIEGFEIEITGWEGKFKLSQDKTGKDQAQAREALLHNHQPKMGGYLEGVYERHVNVGH